MKNMVLEQGIQERFRIASAATSREELGNPVYPPAVKTLNEHGIQCKQHRARQICAEDYAEYDLIIGMDEANIQNMKRFWGGDPDHKLFRLLEFADESSNVVDPWYTGDFSKSWEDINRGCTALLQFLRQQKERKNR